MGVWPIQTVIAAHGLLAGWSDRRAQPVRTIHLSCGSGLGDVAQRRLLGGCAGLAARRLRQQLARRSRQIAVVLPVCPDAVLPVVSLAVMGLAVSELCSQTVMRSASSVARYFAEILPRVNSPANPVR